MGLLSFIKEAIAFRKALKADIQAQIQQEEAYLNMTAEELEQLSDDELFSAVLARTEHIVDSTEEPQDGFALLNEHQQLFYAVSWLEAEVNNGGLCQFFVNSSRLAAPLVSEYMAQLGATEHKELYDSFITKHGINTAELSSFDSDTIEDFQDQYDRYPFDDYDDAFYELAPLQDHLVPFVREHIEAF